VRPVSNRPIACPVDVTLPGDLNAPASLLSRDKRASFRATGTVERPTRAPFLFRNREESLGVQPSHEERLEKIYPNCRAILDPSAWKRIVDAFELNSKSEAFFDILPRQVDDLNLPA
jgi:hypothetical protein